MEAGNENSGRTLYIDLLRIIATLFVILLHCLTGYIDRVAFFNTKTWWLCNAMNEMARTGVPLFFMMSGFLLLSNPKTLDMAHFYRKRFVRILIPFLTWDVLYFIYYNYVVGEQPKGVMAFFKELLVEGSAYHLWFVYSLIPIYLFMPFLKRIIDNCSMKQTVWLFLLVIFTGTIRPFINTVTPLYIFLFNPITEGYIGYVLLGYILGRAEIPARYRTAIYIGGVAGFFIGVIGNRLFSSYAQINLYFNMGYSINHFLCAAALFVLFKYFEPLQKIRTGTWIPTISGLTYSMYLMHALVLDILQRTFIVSVPLFRIALYSLTTFAICLAVAFILSKIKYLNRLLM